MTQQLFWAHDALLPEGWARDVRMTIENGIFTEVRANAALDGATAINAPVVPGMPNLHSHAFQRAMAGLTERVGPTGDNFWTWRELMYRFLERITPEDNAAIAAQVYVELLKAGYTSVAEFHYLHQDPSGCTYANPAEMSEKIVSAAMEAGISLTLLPVFYAHANFGGMPPSPGQRRFIHTAASFDSLLHHCVSLQRHGASQQVFRRVGVAPHSLRAVTPAELQHVVASLTAHDATAPIHIHAAEQQKEIDDCLAWSGVRPVEWLLANAGVDARWCLVHATHLSDDEATRLATSRAVAGLCPTTEANLGDGVFSANTYLAAGGAWGLGGDSHVGVDPFRELALLEYGQRLRAERRNVLATPGCASIGQGLYQQALQGGARALGQRIGAIAVGACADFMTLNRDDPALVDRDVDGLLDAAIFGPARHPVRDVMVGGVWVVREGHHAHEETIFARYRATLRKLLQ